MANVPTIFDESPLNIFDPFDVFSGFKFPDPSTTVFGKNADRLMKTDIRETDKGYSASAAISFIMVLKSSLASPSFWKSAAVAW